MKWMVGMALVAKPLIAMIYGPRWIPAAPILSILSLSTALWPIHVLNLAAIGALGRSDLLLRVEVPKQLVGIVLIVAIAHWGPVAIAWAVFASGFIGAAINAYYSKKLLDYGLVEQLLDQGATFALSLAAAGAGWVILQWARPGPLPLICAIAGAATMYGLLAVLTRNAALAGLLSVTRTLREKPEESVQ